MPLLRIRKAAPLNQYVLRLTLTDGTDVERDVANLMTGPIFEPLRGDAALFGALRVEAGTVIWPNGADLDPDVLIWGGPPPAQASVRPPAKLAPKTVTKTS